jgi:hypothetical protein
MGTNEGSITSPADFADLIGSRDKFGGLMLRCNTAHDKVSMHFLVIALIAIDLCLLNTKISEQKLAPRQYRFHVRSL